MWATWRVWTLACDEEENLSHLSHHPLQRGVLGPLTLCQVGLLDPTVPFATILCNLYGNLLSICYYHEILSFWGEERRLVSLIP